MRQILEHLTADDELGLVRWGQSNALPNGDRDSEGYVESPHLKLRPAGLDLTIAAIVAAVAGGAHGAIGTRSVVTVGEVGEALAVNEWAGAELRLVQHDYGDAVASSLRRGHARVISNGLVLSNNTNLAGGGSMVIDATADKVLWLNHGRPAGSQVVFATSGTLPGLTAGRPYYVVNPSPHAFQLSEDPHGAVVDLNGGTGTHTCTTRPYLVVEWLSVCQAVAAGVTFSIGTPGVVNHTAHGRTEGSTVSFDANVPPELTAGVRYYVVAPTANAYNVSQTLGGAPIAFSGAGGSANATPHLLAFVSGYVHLHDRFKTYDNVQVVTPYQPIEPGDYPAGAPAVPGVTLAADVTSWADCALVLPWTWNEGVDGHGAAGTATVAGLVVTLQGGQTIEADLFADGFLRVGGAKGKVASNTATTVTVQSWTPAAGPGAGVLPFVLHLPHWRSNPHHFTAGEGFLYPSSHMQPGGHTAASTGLIYSRPRGRLAGSYTTRVLEPAPVSAAINAAQLAQCVTAASAQLTAAIVGGKLRLQRASTSRDPASGLIQFEDFLRAGYTVQVTGLGQTPNVDGLYRVAAVHHTDAAGSWVDLDLLDQTVATLPGAVAGAVPAGASVQRRVWRPQSLFGSLIDVAWRTAIALGRRIVVAHLGINATSQILARSHNQTSFQGQLGWWDDNIGIDWTPSNPGGLAARLQRLVQFIAPRAVQASLGTQKRWRVVAIDAWQAEADAMSPAGRQLARSSLPAFAAWLRGVITTAGLSPFPASARIPFHWALVTTTPWMLAEVGGDVDGLVNASLRRWVALDGFAAAIDPNDSPKLSDQLHFNGVGEARNGKAVAEALVPLIVSAFAFRLGASAIDVANEALSHVGDTPNVTSLEPPNATEQARRAAQFLPTARKEILQSHPFTFATRRVQLTAIENTVSTWSQAYALPPDCLHPVWVLDPNAPDDLQLRAAAATDPYRRQPTPSASTHQVPASQPFTIESEDGYRVLRTNQPDAVLVYVRSNVAFEAWDPLARSACTYRLAKLLAGVLVKGKAGAAQSREHMQMSLALLQQAAATNAEYQRDVRPEAGCPWLP